MPEQSETDIVPGTQEEVSSGSQAAATVGKVRESFSRAEVLRVLKLSSQKLSRWERNGIYQRRENYSFGDLLALRKLEALSSQVSLREIREGLEAVRERYAQLSDPLAQLGLFAARHRLLVSHEGQQMEAVSGQLTLDLSSQAPGGARALPAKSQRFSWVADEWFAYGVSLEPEPERRAEAIQAYLHCLELNPRHASAWINLGTLRYHEGNFEECERCYRTAVEIDSEYALAFFDLGNVLDETGRLTEAIDAYQRAVAIAPRYGDAHYNLALAYEKSGQRRRAMAHWRAYLRIDNTSAWAEHARLQLRRGLEKDTLQLVAVKRRQSGRR